MRIRSIKPAWWSDHDLHTRLSAQEREFYIGLWQQADDAGWLVWDVHRIGAELYPFRTVRRREAFIEAAAEKLQALHEVDPHLIILLCGHARVPKMPSHQHLGGKPVFTVQTAHERCRARSLATPPDSPVTPAIPPHGRGGNGKGGNEMAAPAGARGSKTPESDEERLTRYRSMATDPLLSLGRREAAQAQVALMESGRVH